MVGDAPEQLVGGLDDDATLAHEVARAQDREGVVGERRRHERTVRSVARARNRPRTALACGLVVGIAILFALFARAAAAPASGAELEADEVLSANLDEAGELDAAGALDAVGGLDAAGALALPGDDPAARELEAIEAATLGAALDLGLDGDLPGGEAETQPRRPRWGRLDLSIAWRRTTDDTASGPSRRGALWLLATWSR